MGRVMVPRQQPTDLGIVDFEVGWRHQFQITNIHTQDENDYINFFKGGWGTYYHPITFSFRSTLEDRSV